MFNPYLRGGPELVQKFKEKPSTLLSVLSVRMNQLMIMLSRYIVSQKLAGNPLQTRTGKLAASVHHIPASIQGQKVVGYVESSAPPAGYGILYEKGHSAPWEITAVRAKALHYVMDGRNVFAKRVTHPPVEAMRWMKSSLEENKSAIVAELQTAVNEVLKK